MTRKEAIAYLTERHAEQTILFPVRMRKVPLSLYLRRNVRGAMAFTCEES